MKNPKHPDRRALYELRSLRRRLDEQLSEAEKKKLDAALEVIEAHAPPARAQHPIDWEQALAWAAAQERPWAAAELAAHFQSSNPTARKHIRRMIAEGLILRTTPTSRDSQARYRPRKK